jgi:hypothetical protein
METFTLSDKQLKKINRWVKKHPQLARGTIGGTFTYSFTPTSLGVVEKVKHNPSGDELDVTEYQDW